MCLFWNGSRKAGRIFFNADISWYGPYYYISGALFFKINDADKNFIDNENKKNKKSG